MEGSSAGVSELMDWWSISMHGVAEQVDFISIWLQYVKVRGESGRCWVRRGGLVVLFVKCDITATIGSQKTSDIWNACRMTVLLYVINCSVKWCL